MLDSRKCNPPTLKQYVSQDRRANANNQYLYKPSDLRAGAQPDPEAFFGSSFSSVGLASFEASGCSLSCAK